MSLATMPQHQSTVTDDALRYLGLDRRNPATVAMVAVCDKYDLDPLLGHVLILKSGEGPKVYVTRDGLLDIAHRSGRLDGIVVDEQRESERGWSCTVSVWRNDMSHPFTYKGGCGKQEPQARRGNGAEMALARAERRALKRAFRIATTDYELDDSGNAPVGEVFDVDAVEDVDQATGEITTGASKAHEPGIVDDGDDTLPGEPEAQVEVVRDVRTCVRCGGPLGTNPLEPAAGGWAHKGGCPSTKDERV